MKYSLQDQSVFVAGAAAGIGKTTVRVPVANVCDATRAEHPIGRLGCAKESAHAIVFLLSDSASFIIGNTLVADGGYTAH